MDENHLRERIRRAFAAGALPDRRPDHMWGGPGSGTECALCGEPTMTQEAELELEFVTEGCDGPICHHVHARCWKLWESERQRAPAEAQAPKVQPTEDPGNGGSGAGGGGTLMRTSAQGTITDREHEPNPR